MNRRDRANLAIDWIETQLEAGAVPTKELVEEAIQRNALGESEVTRLAMQVRTELRARGYDGVAPPPQGAAPWLLLGAAILLALVLVVLLAAGTI